MTLTKSVVIPASALAPARLSDMIRDQPIDMQRHIHTAIIRAVGSGELRGLKLAERIQLPHSQNSNRMIAKSDIAFRAVDVPVAQQIIAAVIQKYAEKTTRIGRNRLSYREFLKLTPEEFDRRLEAQLEADEQMRGYRKTESK